MLGIGVVGYGYWGPNLVRNFQEGTASRVVRVCDQKPDRLALVNRRYPTIETGSDYRELLGDARVDAIVIATPVTSHFDLALAALKAGKHVFVEKPLTASSTQAERLIEEAEKRRLILQVDHTFVYTGAVKKIRELVADGSLGDLYYYDSVRVNLGLFQHDVNVIWDLAVHDLSIMDYIVRGKVAAVSATGTSHIAGQPENIAYLTIFFDSSLIAHLHVNWLAPVKVRRSLIGGSRKMVIYDDLEPSEKVKIYDTGITLANTPDSVYQMLVSYRTGDMWAPKVDLTEALKTEAESFAQCVATGARPVTDGQAGLRVVEILQAASESMKDRGRPVEVAIRETAR
jgi:predicted dehydrogenase